MLRSARDEWETISKFVPDDWVTTKELSKISGLGAMRVTFGLMHARTHGQVEEETRIFSAPGGQKVRKSVYRKRQPPKTP